MVVDDTMPEKDDTTPAEQAPVLTEMTVKELRSLLKQNKLLTSGNKKTLIERLQVSLCHSHIRPPPVG
jgi:hypothetical protein